MSELQYLDCAVSLLTNFQERGQLSGTGKWGVHGIWLEFKDRTGARKKHRRNLPEVAEEQGLGADGKR